MLKFYKYVKVLYVFATFRVNFNDILPHNFHKLKSSLI
jgi:hypothetical protein